LRALGLILLLGGSQLVPAPDWAGRLKAGYPGHIVSVGGGEVVMRDGTRLPEADVGAMFAQPYPAGRIAPPAPGHDPGRERYEPFFDRIYGDCRKGQVAPHLRNVRWVGGGKVRVTTVNGMAEHLEAVVRDLEKLPPAMTHYLVPSAGYYACRAIAGTTRRSMHAYGAAIDLSTAHADYWRWTGGEGAKYRNRIPFEIVAIFEKHGFIWGGKWSHFDTMHFEYRPELLPAG
jgi:hypothetical protein